MKKILLSFILLFITFSLHAFQFTCNLTEENKIENISYKEYYGDFDLTITSNKENYTTELLITLKEDAATESLKSIKLIFPTDIYNSFAPELFSNIEKKEDLPYKGILEKLCLFITDGIFLKSENINENGHWEMIFSFDYVLAQKFQSIYNDYKEKGKNDLYRLSIRTVISRNKKLVEKNFGTILEPIENEKKTLAKLLLRMALRY